MIKKKYILQWKIKGQPLHQQKNLKFDTAMRGKKYKEKLMFSYEIYPEVIEQIDE